MFGLSNFIITEFLLIFYSLVTNVLYSYNVRVERFRDLQNYTTLKQVSEEEYALNGFKDLQNYTTLKPCRVGTYRF